MDKSEYNAYIIKISNNWPKLNSLDIEGLSEEQLVQVLGVPAKEREPLIAKIKGKNAAASYQISFDGKLLARGFWLYVWEITPPEGEKLYYVGRTGDSSSLNAQSPFNRMGQHLGFNENSNVLRRHLEKNELNVNAELCHFRLVAYGPILPESKDESEYRRRRNIIGALEKALADAFKKADYEVMNRVYDKNDLDQEIFTEILKAFAVEFPDLAKNLEGGKKEKSKPINIDEDPINANWLKFAGLDTKGLTRNQLLQILKTPLEKRKAFVAKLQRERK